LFNNKNPLFLAAVQSVFFSFVPREIATVSGATENAGSETIKMTDQIVDAGKCKPT